VRVFLEGRQDLLLVLAKRPPQSIEASPRSAQLLAIVGKRAAPDGPSHLAARDVIETPRGLWVADAQDELVVADLAAAVAPLRKPQTPSVGLWGKRGKHDPQRAGRG